MKVIMFSTKETKANTTYVKMSREDTTFVLSTLHMYKQMIEWCRTNDYEKYDAFMEPMDFLPKRGQPPYGKNSYYTFITGVLNNMVVNKTQYNFSNRTLSGIQDIMNGMYRLGFEDIEIVFKRK